MELGEEWAPFLQSGTPVAAEPVVEPPLPDRRGERDRCTAGGPQVVRVGLGGGPPDLDVGDSRSSGRRVPGGSQFGWQLEFDVWRRRSSACRVISSARAVSQGPKVGSAATRSGSGGSQGSGPGPVPRRVSSSR